MKDTKKNDSSSYAGKKASLVVPSSTGRHSNSKMKSVADKAMQGGKIKK